MTSRPILFSAPMVRAILDGRKSQTRRVLKPGRAGVPDPIDGYLFKGHALVREEGSSLSVYPIKCPYGMTGDRLWVRETWAYHLHAQGSLADDDGPWVYAADGESALQYRLCERWRPSIHMPRYVSRITLEVTDVRVERLQDISEADAVAEGCEASPFPGPWWQGYRDCGDLGLMHQQAIGETPPDWMIEPKRMRSLTHLDRTAIDGYRTLWANINGAGSWDLNPWVWVVSFARLGPGLSRAQTDIGGSA